MRKDEVFRRLILLAAAAGLLMRVILYQVVWLLVRQSPQLEQEMLVWIYGMRIFVSIVLFFAVGFLMRQKRYSRKQLFLATGKLMGYGLAILVLEQALGANVLTYWLYLPLELFSWIQLVLNNVLPAAVAVLPSVAAPLLWSLFGKK